MRPIELELEDQSLGLNYNEHELTKEENVRIFNRMCGLICEILCIKLKVIIFG